MAHVRLVRIFCVCRVWVVLYKRFVCSFGDCARIRTNMGAKHLLDCALLVCCNQYCAIWGFLPTPCFAIQHAVMVFVVAISCKGQCGGDIAVTVTGYRAGLTIDIEMTVIVN